MVKVLNITLYIFYHNKKKKGRKYLGRKNAIISLLSDAVPTPWLGIGVAGWGLGQGSKVQPDCGCHLDCHNGEGLLPRRKLRRGYRKLKQMMFTAKVSEGT